VTTGADRQTAPRRDFATRSDEAEWLDGAEPDGAELAAVLRDLAWLNTTMLGHYPILRWLGRAARDLRPDRPLRLLDAGCGYGDLLRAIRRWTDRRGLRIELLGVDLNPETIRAAKAASRADERIDFAVGDILRFAPAEPVDLIVSSLVAHHLPDAEIVTLLDWMEANARRGWLACDLHRHPVPYHVIGLAGTLFGVHPTVVHDGQISVARALTREEWRNLIAAAGMAPDDVTVRWFLFRWLIGRLR
jgi:SAM-dependent methyltransferase